VSATAPNITATFSQAMSASTLTSSTFTLTGGGTTVAGTVAYANSVATFTPTAALAYNTAYTATITTGVQSALGAPLAASVTWTFTTGAAPVPTVTTTIPASGATGVSATTPIMASFSVPMNSSTITSSTFTVTEAGGAPVTGTVTYSNGSGVCGLVCSIPTATFAPSANLAYNTVYTAAITTGAQSSAGVALAANYAWTFTTSPVPPTVLSVTPVSGATAVPVTTILTATFSQSMTASTINASTFTLAAAGGGSVTGTVTFVAGTSVATFTPSSSLAFNTQYTATITTGVQNASGTALAANYTWSFGTAVVNPNLATVNFTNTLQTIQGFGGSTAFLGQMPQAVATALFSPTKGLGLSILRVRIDPTGSASGGGNNGDPYETGEWDYEAANGKLAVTANPNAVVFASPWTPPAAWKLSGTTVTVSGNSYNEAYYSGGCSPNAPTGLSYCGGYLDPNHYADYANYLEDFVRFFNTTNGFNLYAISMQNEPEENVSYESCVWDPIKMDAWVAGNASTIASDPYSTKLIMPESDDFNPVDAATTLSDPKAEGQVSIIGGHIYDTLFGGSITPYPALPAGDTPKALWMTEFGPLSTSTPTWTEAVTTYAPTIHNSMVVGQYSAYVWWGIFGAPTNAGSYGLVDNSGNPTVFGNMMGQYSKFVLPGYTNVGVTNSANESANVLISAYTGSASGAQHYVIVAINTSSAAVSQSFTLQNGAVTSVTPYQSTSAAGLAQQSAVNVANGQFTYTLPALSITTFVQ
jgi:O-glycosyl hydrolase